jgi:ABC-2 type transport system permease protein
MNSMTIHLRREFWEHRSLWIAPAIWAGIITLMFAWVIFGVIPGQIGHGVSFQGADSEVLSQLDESDRREIESAVAQARERHHEPSDAEKETFFAFSHLAITGLISFVACIVVFFYLLDCLYAERRDRSILFWKSLPISDSRVVLSKLAVAMVVVPLGVILLAAVVQLLIGLMVWLRFHGSPLMAHLPDWSLITWAKSLIVSLLIGFTGVLWYAPIAGYLLLMSSWARRNVFLWAVLPPVALIALEGFFFHSTKVAQFVAWRFAGHARLLHLDPDAFDVGTRNSSDELPHAADVLSQLDLSGMFLNAEVWVGMAAAAALVFVAIRLRRYRDES